MEQIFSEAPAVMALYTGPEHVITLVNPSWERTVGKPSALGRPFADVFPELAGTGVIGLLDQVYETGDPYLDPELSIPLERWGSGALRSSSREVTPMSLNLTQPRALKGDEGSEVRMKEAGQGGVPARRVETRDR